jgi:hypothetical protein
MEITNKQQCTPLIVNDNVVLMASIKHRGGRAIAFGHEQIFT